MNALPFYDNRYIKTKIRLCDMAYTNFCCWNVPEDGVEYKSFTIISIDSLIVYDNKYYLQVYVDNCIYEIVDKQIVDYLDDYLFDFGEISFLKNEYYARIDF